MYPSGFIDKNLMSELTAKMLLEINAVHFNSENPYKLTSGLTSPVYIDCRKLISYPRIRNTLMEFAVSTLFRDVGFEVFDAVAGGETAGIPFAAWISDKMGLPMQYVRKQPKGFGRNAQIEGDISAGQKVLLVEDLTTDGGSKIKFCKALRDAGAVVNHAIVVFYYDIFSETKAVLKSNDLNLHSLATWRDVLLVCKNNNYFDVQVLNEVESFLNSPLEWSEKNGGVNEIVK
jgi:orotate phosphoribosyltransferase